MDTDLTISSSRLSAVTCIKSYDVSQMKINPETAVNLWSASITLIHLTVLKTKDLRLKTDKRWLHIPLLTRVKIDTFYRGNETAYTHFVR